jgi:hypothetical protein
LKQHTDPDGDVAQSIVGVAMPFIAGMFEIAVSGWFDVFGRRTLVMVLGAIFSTAEAWDLWQSLRDNALYVSVRVIISAAYYGLARASIGHVIRLTVEPARARHALGAFGVIYGCISFLRILTSGIVMGLCRALYPSGLGEANNCFSKWSFDYVLHPMGILCWAVIRYRLGSGSKIDQPKAGSHLSRAPGEAQPLVIGPFAEEARFLSERRVMVPDKAEGLAVWLCALPFCAACAALLAVFTAEQTMKAFLKGFVGWLLVSAVGLTLWVGSHLRAQAASLVEEEGKEEVEIDATVDDLAGRVLEGLEGGPVTGPILSLIGGIAATAENCKVNKNQAAFLARRVEDLRGHLTALDPGQAETNRPLMRGLAALLCKVHQFLKCYYDQRWYERVLISASNSKRFRELHRCVVCP